MTVHLHKGSNKRSPTGRRQIAGLIILHIDYGNALLNALVEIADGTELRSVLLHAQGEDNNTRTLYLLPCLSVRQRVEFKVLLLVSCSATSWPCLHFIASDTLRDYVDPPDKARASRERSCSTPAVSAATCSRRRNR